MPLDSSPEQPLPVRTVARSLADWVGRLGRVWVEGQVTEVRSRGATCYLVLRDPAADMSLRVTCAAVLVRGLQPPLAEGHRVVVQAKPEFWPGRGDLSLVASDIRPVGVGLLLARLEQLRAMLAAEGLFAADRKRSLPLLPRAVGLITGRGSAAERDVVENSRRRWPGVRFAIENVAVQGPSAAGQVTAALRRLDALDGVDVIVIARGGGSVEDLLPFSDEGLVRAIAAARTPVVSAVGHESDTPLIDHVVDARASTPTDAAKLVVPDMIDERARIVTLRDRARRAVTGRLVAEQQWLADQRARPVLADPVSRIDRLAEQLAAARERGRRAALHCTAISATEIADLSARVRALSPQATLDRGYAVMQRQDGSVLREAAGVTAGERLTARLASGRIGVVVEEMG
jgi:exodeoxyribonuclease VII large subunit